MANPLGNMSRIVWKINDENISGLKYELMHARFLWWITMEEMIYF